jgi:hypothetical protein
MTKLLEKAVAKRMQYDIVKYKLIQANQFGGRAHSSCLDAGLALIHDVQEAHRRGLKCGILLFDVRGFFDNVNHGRMTAILENLGYPPELVRWSEAFLKDRKVHLSFNNVISDERGQPIGVPQGSPLSLVFSITYTSSLLAMMKGWNNSSLGMYVDDGILFACAEDWRDVARILTARYVTDLQGPPSERTQTEKIRDLKSLARQYARDQGSCDDTRISYLEFVESEAKADWTLARMIAG